MTSHRRALDQLAAHYGDLAQRARFTLTVAPSEDRSYQVAVLGVVRDQRQLILRAPTTAEGGLIAVVRGQGLVCRWFNATSAFRFRAVIAKVVFEPLPMLYVELPTSVERKVIRRVPRALVNLYSLLHMPEPREALVVDLSVNGARLALPAHLSLATGQAVELAMRTRMLDRSFLLNLNATVSQTLGPSDPAHPDIQFAGVEFGDVGEHDLLVLHAYVQQHLASEADWLSYLLSESAHEPGPANTDCHVLRASPIV